MGQRTALSCSEGHMEASIDIQLNGKPNCNSFYSALVQNKTIAVLRSFVLESGVTIQAASVAYSTWGMLNETGTNAIVVCHALTGSSDAMDWWGPLFGPGKALDPTRYFIFCANVLGSPYGSASPVSTNPSTGQRYGPAFPDTTVRDDVRVHKLILDALGVKSVAAVIGGSMGGMTTLEWPLCTPRGYVQNIVPIATSAYHGGWGISWGETQRQAIYSDARFKNGWYEPTPEGQPRQGLGTARMIAMLTYRSNISFEARFSRRPATVAKAIEAAPLPTPPGSHRGIVLSGCTDDPGPVKFSAQSYLHYQAEKFLKRFDANCYIHLTKKMDSHDVTRGRLAPTSSPLKALHSPGEEGLRRVLSVVPPNALVVSVRSDILFRPEQQLELSRCLPDARFLNLESTDGHDGFLLEFETLNNAIRTHLEEQCSWAYEGEGYSGKWLQLNQRVDSVFGEAETVAFE